jgi:hypothetical protein
MSLLIILDIFVLPMFFPLDNFGNAVPYVVITLALIFIGGALLTRPIEETENEQ